MNKQIFMFGFLFLLLIFIVPSVKAAENISVEIISNITLVNDMTEGDGMPIVPSRDYLFEEESINFEVLVTIPSGLENLEVEHSQWGDQPAVFVAFNNIRKSDCFEGRVISNISQEFNCTMTAETMDSMHGVGYIDVRARTIQGDEASDYVGTWFFNPIVGLNHGEDINFGLANPGERIYSQPIVIRSAVEEGSNVPLDMYITGTDFYDGSGNSGAMCPTTNQLQLRNLAYYAENGNYSTLNDPRADSEGFVPIDYGIGFNDPFIFWGNSEIIQVPGINGSKNCDSPYPHVCPNSYTANKLEYDKNFTLIFRVDVPLPCTGHFDVGNIYVWGAGDAGYGPTVGYDIDFNLEATPEYPQIVKCGNTTYLDDNTEPGRVSMGGEPLVEREDYYILADGENTSTRYMFEGEQIHWNALVVERNGISKIDEVYVTIGSTKGPGNDVEVNCRHLSEEAINFDSCNVNQLNGNYTSFDSNIMKYYDCTFTVETSDSMYGQYWIVPEVMDVDGQRRVINESELFYLNPVISISINDTVRFNNLTIGKTSYSNEIEVKNNADAGSGVKLDMFISGTNFYTTNGADVGCSPEENRLNLSFFRYYAENGIYSTTNDLEIGRIGGLAREKDSEGYVNMDYGFGFNNPNVFYDGFEMIQDGQNGAYYDGNEIGIGESVKIKFKLNVPADICSSTFDAGEIYLWAEAI